MSQVFYRKYRPQNFTEIVGQDNVVRVLDNSLKQGRVGHAYLFSGPRGTGKTTIARILAKSLGSSIEDTIEIDAASSRGIDEARALRDAVKFLPLNSPQKVYIIDEVHMLTKEAFNALLKTLEEPPEHAVFVLATTELQKVPDTIISRTQHLEFGKISIANIVRELHKISKSENLEVADDAQKLIAFLAEGSLRDAENMLYQVVSATNSKKITEEDTRLVLGAPKEELISSIIKHVLKKEVSPMLDFLDKTLSQGGDPKTIGKFLLRGIRASYFLAIDKNTQKMLEKEFSSDEIQFFVECSKAGKEHLEYTLRALLDSSQMETDDYLPQLPLELALLKSATHGKIN
jgi:DNA polymerase III subunit gamma/tau